MGQPTIRNTRFTVAFVLKLLAWIFLLLLTSVITLRLGTPHPHSVAKILCQVLPRIQPDLVRGAIISLTEDKIKVRLLPVH